MNSPNEKVNINSKRSEKVIITIEVNTTLDTDFKNVRFAVINVLITILMIASKQ